MPEKIFIRHNCIRPLMDLRYFAVAIPNPIRISIAEAGLSFSRESR